MFFSRGFPEFQPGIFILAWRKRFNICRMIEIFALFLDNASFLNSDLITKTGTPPVTLDQSHLKCFLYLSAKDTCTCMVILCKLLCTLQKNQCACLYDRLISFPSLVVLNYITYDYIRSIFLKRAKNLIRIPSQRPVPHKPR